MSETPASLSPDSPSTASRASSRIPRACDSCHSKKIKCDGVRPRCNWCQHHGLDCTFDRARGGRRRNNRSRKLEESDLVRRMERIETLITDSLKRRNGKPDTISRDSPVESKTKQPQQPDPAQAESPSIANVGRIYCAGYKLGDINMFHGVPFLSREGQKWIGLRVGETDVPSSVRYEAQGLLWHNHRPAWPSDSQPAHVSNGMQALPPRAFVQKYLDAYLGTEVADVFPLADPVLFPQIIEKVYGGGSETDAHGGRAAKACVLAFLALAATLLNNPFDETLPPIELSGGAGELIFADIVNARASTEAVVALMMLAVYQFNCGHIHPLDISLSIASRLLFMLGAHLYPGEDVDVLTSEPQSIETRTILHRRDLFWICYSLDKEITFRTGRPPIMNDTSCDLTFPKWYLRQRSTDCPTAFRLPGDLSLTLIKSKAYAKLYSPHSLQKSDAEILGDIRELDEMLENWRLSQQAELRPKLAFSPACLPMNPRSFFLKMEYYHCMTTIHQASSRCKDWAHNHRVYDGLSSSLDLALQSSRSLLAAINSADSVFAEVPNLFWVVLFYPLSATLTLFCNILLSPASAAGSFDTIFLRECLNHIGDRVHRVCGLSDLQLQHLKSVYDFTDEVVRAAESLVLQSQSPSGLGKD